MAEDVIKGSELIADDYLVKAQEQIDSYLKSLLQVEDAMKHIATITKKDITLKAPDGIGDVKADQEKINKTKDLTEAYKVLSLERAKALQLTREGNNLTRQQAALDLAGTGSLKALRAEYNLLYQQFEKTTDAKERDIKVTGSLAQRLSVLDGQIKTLDGNVGKHQRNVGNYTESLIKLGRGFGGVTGLINTLGNAFGFNTELIQNFHDISKALIKTSRELNHTTELQTLATETNTVATEANVAITTEQVIAEEASTAAIVEQSVASKAAATAQAAFNAVAMLNPYILIATAAALAAVAIYQFATSESEAEKKVRELNDRLQFQNIEAKESIEFLKESQEDLLKIQDERIRQLKVDGATEETINARKKEDIIEQINNNIRLSKVLDDRINIEAGLLANMSSTDKAFADQQSKVHDLQREQTSLGFSNKDLKLTYDELNKGIKEVATDDNSPKKGSMNYYNEQLSKAQKNLNGAVIGTKAFADALKQIANAQRDIDDAIAKAKEQRGDINISPLTSKKTAPLINPKTTPEVIAHKQISDLKLNDTKEFTDSELKEIQDAKKKEIDLIKSSADEAFKIKDDQYKKESELNDKKISQIDSELKTQADLLISGQDNIYAQLERKKAEALAKQAKLDEQAAKRKQKQQIVDIFLEFVKADIAAGGGKDGFNGALKAAAETAAVQTIAKGLSGFYEGTEDTGKGGNADSRGGFITKLHPHERVMTAVQNKAIGTISNTDLVKAAIQYQYSPVNNTSINDSRIVESNKVVADKIDYLTFVIKNKKEISVAENLYGHLIKSEKENGNINTTINIPNPIIRNRTR